MSGLAACPDCKGRGRAPSGPPSRENCPDCGAKGWTQDLAGTILPCRRCRGSRRLETPAPEAPCKACEGRGKGPCRPCKGSGRIETFDR